MAANDLDGSPSSDRSDHFDLHDRDEGLDKRTPSNLDRESQESNSSPTNGGSPSRREEKQVSERVFVFPTLSLLENISYRAFQD